MALQLDADIENKTLFKKTAHESDNNPLVDIEHNQDDEKQLKCLYEQFQAITLLEANICEKNLPQKVFIFSKPHSNKV